MVKRITCTCLKPKCKIVSSSQTTENENISNKEDVLFFGNSGPEHVL